MPYLFETEEHEALRARARRFAEKHIAPRGAEWEENEEFPIELYRTASEAGITGTGYPEEVGGQGGDLGHNGRWQLRREANGGARTLFAPVAHSTRYIISRDILHDHCEAVLRALQVRELLDRARRKLQSVVEHEVAAGDREVKLPERDLLRHVLRPDDLYLNTVYIDARATDDRAVFVFEHPDANGLKRRAPCLRR